MFHCHDRDSTSISAEKLGSIIVATSHFAGQNARFSSLPKRVTLKNQDLFRRVFGTPQPAGQCLNGRGRIYGSGAPRCSLAFRIQRILALSDSTPPSVANHENRSSINGLDMVLGGVKLKAKNALVEHQGDMILIQFIDPN
jgi:hypothetical protein